MKGFLVVVAVILLTLLTANGTIPALMGRPLPTLRPGGAAVAQAAPAETGTPTPAQLGAPGPDYAATAQAANALAAIAIGQTQQAADATAGAQTQAAAQTADARAAVAFAWTQAAGDSAQTATRQALAGTQAAATLTTAPVTQAYLLTAEAHRTQIVVDEQARIDSRDRWSWLTAAAAIGLVVALIAAGLALYDWLAGRTAVERAEADRIRLLAQEEARARRQAILALAQPRPAEPGQAPAARMPIEVGGQPLPQHPPETMHVLYVLSRCIDIAGDSSTVLPTAAKLQSAGISTTARQAAVGPLVAAGLVETTPGGGTTVAGGLSIRQLYDTIYAGGITTPAPAELETA